MRTRRQNIQLDLALEPEAKGEARSAGDQGTEARMARAEPERPATGGDSPPFVKCLRRLWYPPDRGMGFQAARRRRDDGR